MSERKGKPNPQIQYEDSHSILSHWKPRSCTFGTPCHPAVAMKGQVCSCRVGQARVIIFFPVGWAIEKIFFFNKISKIVKNFNCNQNASQTHQMPHKCTKCLTNAPNASQTHQFFKMIWLNCWMFICPAFCLIDKQHEHDFQIGLHYMH